MIIGRVIVGRVIKECVIIGRVMTGVLIGCVVY